MRENAATQLKLVAEHITRSPTARELLRQWRTQPDRPKMVVDVYPGSGDGHSWPPGHIKIGANDLANTDYGAAVIVHEWLGHTMEGGKLRALTGQEYNGLSTEMISRARGWRVWLELDPQSALKDWELSRFLDGGPSTYWDELRQPGRTYFLSLGIDDLVDPKLFLLNLAQVGENSAHTTSQQMAKVARQLAEDAAVMEKYKREGSDPRVRNLATTWAGEIEDLRQLGKIMQKKAQGPGAN